MTILLIDSYDSFTFNLRSLIAEATGEKVITIHNDSITSSDLQKYIPYLKAIVIGPGPGHPSIASDVGLIPNLFDGSVSEVPIPILGICLGFQSLCLSQGCEVNKLDSIKHGQVYDVNHFKEDELFRGVPQGFKSVRYHSLYVPELNDKLINLGSTRELDTDQEIIMSAKHSTNPWYGVQYHPESICSEFGDHLLKNFMKLANKHNEQTRQIKPYDSDLFQSIIMKVEIPKLLQTPALSTPSFFQFKEISNEKKSVEICDLLNTLGKEFILLNSASFPGDWSIIGLPSSSSLYITHSTESPDKIVLEQNGETKEILLSGKTIWEFASHFMADKLSSNYRSKENFPFIGGLLGIFSYEEGEFINFENLPKITSSDIPDTKLVYVEECILIDHSSEKTYLTTLNSSTKLEDIETIINTPYSFIHPDTSIPTIAIEKPTKGDYAEQFDACQHYLSTGDSYELCLTSSTKLSIPKSQSPWSIYKTLTLKNPSPYSAFFNFKDCCLISSSPERFVKWDDEYCELRPIKGTVKKTPTMDFAKASAILNTPKEIGENLMIVDLIRHDLYNFLKDVKVDKLMQVEEYSTVYQLVSVIQGWFEKNSFQGIDILSKSLPPGSMTGAPKKRSIEILQALEKRRRGLYSGVCGYWSVDNRSDWSVIIRSIYHYYQDLENDEDVDIWRIGAGGAITVLSDLEGEWAELLTKLDSALQTFKLE